MNWAMNSWRPWAVWRQKINYQPYLAKNYRPHVRCNNNILFIMLPRPIWCMKMIIISAITRYHSSFTMMFKNYQNLAAMDWPHTPLEFNILYGTFIYGSPIWHCNSWQIGTDSLRQICSDIVMILFFTARCTLVHSAVLRSYIVRPSVRLSVCL